MSCTLQQYINQHGIHVVYLSTLSNPKIPQNLPEKSTRVANTSSFLPCYLFDFFFRLVNDTFCCYFSILQEKVFPFYETHSTGQDGYQKCCTENFATSLFGSSKYLAKDLMKIYPRTFFLFFLLKLRAENIIFRVAQVLTTGKGLWHLFLVEWGRIPTEKNSQDEGGRPVILNYVNEILSSFLANSRKARKVARKIGRKSLFFHPRRSHAKCMSYLV